jgi:hypothetical protein
VIEKVDVVHDCIDAVMLFSSAVYGKKYEDCIVPEIKRISPPVNPFGKIIGNV